MTSHALPVEKTSHRLLEGLRPVLAHKQVFEPESCYVTFGSSIKILNHIKRVAMIIPYAKQSKTLNLLDAEWRRVVLFKDVVFSKIADWTPSLEIFRRAHHFEISRHSESSVPRHEGKIDHQGVEFSSRKFLTGKE